MERTCAGSFRALELPHLRPIPAKFEITRTSRIGKTLVASQLDENALVPAAGPMLFAV